MYSETFTTPSSSESPWSGGRECRNIVISPHKWIKVCQAEADHDGISRGLYPDRTSWLPLALQSHICLRKKSPMRFSLLPEQPWQPQELFIEFSGLLISTLMGSWELRASTSREFILDFGNTAGFCQLQGNSRPSIHSCIHHFLCYTYKIPW